MFKLNESFKRCTGRIRTGYMKAEGILPQNYERKNFSSTVPSPPTPYETVDSQ